MMQVRHVIYVAINVVNMSKCILRLSWHNYWLIIVSRTHILIITNLNANADIKRIYEHEIRY